MDRLRDDVTTWIFMHRHFLAADASHSSFAAVVAEELGGRGFNMRIIIVLRRNGFKQVEG